MASVKEFVSAIKEWEQLHPQPSLKLFLKERFPGLSKEELQKLLDAMLN